MTARSDAPSPPAAPVPQLPRVESPRLAALFELGGRLWRSRPDLQLHFPAPDPEGLWDWMLWEHDGNEELQRARLPIPPAHLRERVHGEGDPLRFVRSGVLDARTTLRALRLGGFDPAREGGSLLDFGVGCARLTRYFALFSDRVALHGCDVDGDAVRWCRENLDFARFDAIRASPPTPYADGRFDAIYAFSVFSHLPEERHLEWLTELRRIVRPGGVVVLTVHGRRAIDEIEAGRALPHARRSLLAQAEDLRRRGFAFVPYGALRFANERNEKFFAEWDLEQYGDAFVLESYVRSRWTTLFDLVELLAAPDGWQDYVVLRRRPSLADSG